MRLVRLVQRQHVDLFVAMHGVPQVQPRAQLQVAGLKGAFEQQDRSTPAQCPNLLRFGQVQQGKTIGTPQSFKRPLNAVPVGIGLDHRPGLRVGCRLAGTGQVVAQGLGVDGGLYRTWHEKEGRKGR